MIQLCDKKNLTFVDCWDKIILTLSQTTILDSSTLKEFVVDNFEFDEDGKKLSKQAENTEGKGEIACYEQFLLFPQCFQTTCTADTLKPGLVWERVKLVLKNVIKLAKGSPNNIFQDSFNIVLSQQLTHDRSYISTVDTTTATAVYAFTTTTTSTSTTTSAS